MKNTIMMYGEIGYAVFDEKNTQISRAVFSQPIKGVFKPYFKTAKENAKFIKKTYEELLKYENLKVKKAIRR